MRNGLVLTQVKSAGWASMLSLMLHGVFGVAILQMPASWLSTRRAVVEPIDFELLTREEPEPVVAPTEPVAPALPEPDRAPPPPAATALPPPESTGAPSTQGTVAPTVDGAPVAPGTAIQVPEVAPDSRGAVDPRSDAMRLLLDPTAVARGGYVITGPGPSRPSGPAGISARMPGHQTEQEIEATHNGHLRSAAMSKNYITREPVVVRRQPDGSYAWQGPMFSARIAPDGDVTFDDGDDISTDGFSTSGSFDLQGALMGAAGLDPRAAERARFMRETEELRDRLEDAHRREVRLGAARRLTGVLRRDWANTRYRPDTRRRRLFTHWDAIAEDGSMAEVRAAVITFIRENLPAGSPDAYPPEELTRLNARRQSREEFSPY